MNKRLIILGKMNKRLIILGAVTLFTIVIFSIFFGCERIDAGNVGIKVNMTGSNQGVQDIPEVTGWCFYNKALSSIYEYPTSVQHKEYSGDESFIVNSKDGSEFHVSPIINYSMRREKVTTIFVKYRKTITDIENGFIKTAVYDAFRLAANRYTADSLISNRENFENSVRSILDKNITAEGFTLNQFTSNLKYPDTFKNSIEAKNAAVQKALQLENEVKQTEAKAKIQIVQTEAGAHMRQINADAYYEATIKEAKADAEANRLVQQSITPLLIQNKLAKAWDGKLPIYGQTPALFKDISK